MEYIHRTQALNLFFGGGMRWKALSLSAVCPGVFLTLAVCLASTAASAGGRGPGKSLKRLSIAEAGAFERMLAKVHRALAKNYYDPAFRGVDMDARYANYSERLKKAETRGEALAVISAYFAALRDAHSYFAPPDGARRADYGFHFEFFGGRCLVTAVQPDSDAARELQAGDEIVSVDGVLARRENLAVLQRDVDSLDTGGTIRLSVRDTQENTREVALTDDSGQDVSDPVYREVSFADSSARNAAASEQSLSALVRERWVANGNIFIWKMPWFGLDDVQTDSMMQRARKEQALILDLRGNRGGVVGSLQYLTGWFFSDNVLIATPDGRKSMEPIFARGRKKPFTGELFVLVDSRSASGAELFARVMQIEHRGIVIGDRTAGAVRESRFYIFHDGELAPPYGVAISRADLVMSDGHSLEGAGVTPDVLVNPSAADIAAGRDPVLARAAQLAGLNLSAAEAGKFAPFEWAAVQ